MEFKDEMLYRRWGNKTMGDEYSSELIIPKTLKKEVLRFHYDVKTIGHLEVSKSLVKPKENWF